jgi:hypothetical protein
MLLLLLLLLQVLVLGPPRTPLSSKWEQVADLTDNLKQALLDTDWVVRAARRTVCRVVFCAPWL